MEDDAAAKLMVVAHHIGRLERYSGPPTRQFREVIVSGGWPEKCFTLHEWPPSSDATEATMFLEWMRRRVAPRDAATSCRPSKDGSMFCRVRRCYRGSATRRRACPSCPSARGPPGCKGSLDCEGASRSLAWPGGMGISERP